MWLAARLDLFAQNPELLRMMYSVLPKADARVLSFLAEWVPAMRSIYGQRLDRLVLFGSQAAGRARPDSDIDVLVVLDQPEVRPLEELNRQSEMTAAMGSAYGVVVSAIPFALAQWHNPHHPLSQTIRKEGIDLWKRN
jgi:hypothetical protein